MDDDESDDDDDDCWEMQGWDRQARVWCVLAYLPVCMCIMYSNCIYVVGGWSRVHLYNNVRLGE